MKAAVLHEARDIRIGEVETPKAGANDILVKVKACGICGSDLHMYELGIQTSESGMRPELVAGIVKGGGAILGHEYSGEVIQVGEQVKSVKEGDRVVGITLGGGMAEYVKVPGFGDDVFNVYMGQCLKIPPMVSYEEAATIEPLAVSLMATDIAGPSPGETILIVGAGVIGLGVLQVLKAKYSTKVIVASRSQKRLDMAKRLGADIVINPIAGDLFEQLKQTVGAVQLKWFSGPACAVDVAMDCVGVLRTGPGLSVLSQLLKIVRDGAKVVLVGAYAETAPLELNLVFMKNLAILGSIGFEPKHLAGALDLMQTYGVNRKILVTHEFALDQAKEAFETQLMTGEAIKVLIKP